MEQHKSIPGKSQGKIGLYPDIWEQDILLKELTEMDTIYADTLTSRSGSGRQSTITGIVGSTEKPLFQSGNINPLWDVT
jgi:hypothetical protein